ncbi:hypothetical protein MATL_G00127320 [Megalops atlanticus]|uniref:Uncharacterized protein n=1 Tax=Megalops atlanticus TaxID=7932 RepID=A0A9D3TA54_MEGAT|nr:hypothetical protein MATL_G00127320 [Megalops atlanticus]
MKGSSVLVLLLILSAQGRGCNEFMRGVVKNLLTTIKRTELPGFREVFPKNYEISHHYNDSLLCNSDPCCVFSAAVVLSDSWSQLLLLLWTENVKYSFIRELKVKLESIADSIADKKFREDTDPSLLPSVSSTPEALLHFTSALFSTWLEQKCPVSANPCELPMLPPSLPEEESHQMRTDGERKHPHPHPTVSVRDGWMREGEKEKLSGIGIPPTGGLTSVHHSDPFCGPLCFWPVLVALIFLQ